MRNPFKRQPQTIELVCIAKTDSLVTLCGEAWPGGPQPRPEGTAVCGDCADQMLIIANNLEKDRLNLAVRLGKIQTAHEQINAVMHEADETTERMIEAGVLKTEPKEGVGTGPDPDDLVDEDDMEDCDRPEWHDGPCGPVQPGDYDDGFEDDPDCVCIGCRLRREIQNNQKGL